MLDYTFSNSCEGIPRRPVSQMPTEHIMDILRFGRFEGRELPPARRERLELELFIRERGLRS